MFYIHLINGLGHDTVISSLLYLKVATVYLNGHEKEKKDIYTPNPT
jgi:hypothetical protein